MSDDFVEKLKWLVEKERKEEMKEQKREISSLSGKEREKKGRAVLGVRGRIIGEELGYKLLKLGREKEIITEIAVGNEVLISRGKPLKEGFSGMITAVGGRFLIIAIKETPSFPLEDLRVDLYVDDITFRRMKSVLNNITEEGEKVLNYFKGERVPKLSSGENVSFINDRLNKKQKEAVSLALGAEDFFLIHGPFGTGKTKTITEVILQEAKKGRKVLATAESNVAVDNLVENLSGKGNIVRIGHPARVSEELKKHALSFLIEQEKDYASVCKLKKEGEKLIEEQKKYKKPVPMKRRGMSDKEIMKFDYFKKGRRGISAKEISSMAKWISLKEKADAYFEGMRAIEEEIARNVISRAEVILSTNSSAALELLDEVKFDIVVIDEASQATFPSTLIPLSKCPRFVLAGDHKQLPPTVVSKEARDLSITLFETLIEKYSFSSSLLDTEYRMNELLMKFPSKEFYEGEIKPSLEVKNIKLSDLGGKEFSLPIIFIDTAASSSRFENKKKDSWSYFNELEASLVKKAILQLINFGVEEEKIGVIAPYEDQVELLRQELSVKVHTVDGFQGQEREAMILSLVRSNKEKRIGFLRDMRRLNVSLTRAKRKLIIIGDSSTLSSHPVFKKLFQFIKEEGTYHSCKKEITL